VSTTPNEEKNRFIGSTPPREILGDFFDGPLDPLLHLVREQKPDIATVPLATIARQYFDYIAVMAALDVEIAAEYLVVAATLVYLKVEVTAPPIPTELLAEGEETFEEVEEFEECMRRRLVAYSTYKSVAGELRVRNEAQSYFFREAGDPTSELVQRYRNLPDKLAKVLLPRSAPPSPRSAASPESGSRWPGRWTPSGGPCASAGTSSSSICAGITIAAASSQPFLAILDQSASAGSLTHSRLRMNRFGC